MISINPCLQYRKRKTKHIKKQKKECLRSRTKILIHRDGPIPNIFKREDFKQLFEESFITRQLVTKIQNLKCLTRHNIMQLNFSHSSFTFSKDILNMQFAIKRQEKQLQKIIAPQTYHQIQDQSNYITNQALQEQEDQIILRDIEMNDVSLSLQEKQYKNNFEDGFNWKSLCPTLQHYQFRSEDNLAITNMEKTKLDHFLFN